MEKKVICNKCRWKRDDVGVGGIYCGYNDTVIPLYFVMTACENFVKRKKGSNKTLMMRSDK